jgi:hypothetical protein
MIKETPPQEPNVVLSRRRSIRYFLAQNTLGLLHSSAYPTRIPNIR